MRVRPMTDDEILAVIDRIRSSTSAEASADASQLERARRFNSAMIGRLEAALRGEDLRPVTLAQE